MTYHQTIAARPQGELAVGLQLTLLGYKILILTWDKTPVVFNFDAVVSQGSWKIKETLSDTIDNFEEAECTAQNIANSRGIPFHKGM